MEFEQGLFTILETIAPTFPDTAQEGQATPYIVYSTDNTEYERIIDNPNSVMDHIIFQLDIIADRKANCRNLGNSTETALRGMWNTTVGGKLIQDIEILNRFTDYQNQIDKYREVIEFKIYY